MIHVYFKHLHMNIWWSDVCEGWVGEWMDARWMTGLMDWLVGKSREMLQDKDNLDVLSPHSSI